MKLPTTASQTVGPYLHIGLTWLNTPDLVGSGVTAAAITIYGRLVDGDAVPVSDALVEIWQANEHGRYAHPQDTRDLPLTPGFAGFGRMPTDAEGRFAFTTIKPGRVPAAAGGLQAPHIGVMLLMRGMLRHLHTRMYFADEASANADDALLQALPEARRATLVAGVGERRGEYTWEVVLQGSRETVFLDV